MPQILLQKIKDKSARIGVVGLGYVGLPLAVGFGKIGYSITGVDLSAQKVSQINAGVSYIPDIPTAEIADLRRENRLEAFADYAPLKYADVIFICVPTPFDAQKAPDLSFVNSAIAGVAGILSPGQLIILQSTTYPGTTTEVALPMLSRTGLAVGQDFYLAFSPERIDPGQVNSQGFNVQNTPKVVGGVTPLCTQLAVEVLSALTPLVHPVSSPAVAEMAKLLENTFRSVNIALVNELTLLSERMGIDIWEVIGAAKTKPFGFMPFYPGPGVGGHCIPVDPYYLSWKAREFDFYTKFIELAAEVNSEMPYHVAGKVIDALNRAGKAVKNARVLVLGVAFKRDIDDARNSPAERVIELLLAKEANVTYHDPYVPAFSVGGDVFLKQKVRLESVALTQETLAQADCVAVITGHSKLDYRWIAQHSPILLDTVNVTGDFCRSMSNIIRLGAA